MYVCIHIYMYVCIYICMKNNFLLIKKVNPHSDLIANVKKLTASLCLSLCIASLYTTARRLLDR